MGLESRDQEILKGLSPLTWHLKLVEELTSTSVVPLLCGNHGGSKKHILRIELE